MQMMMDRPARRRQPNRPGIAEARVVSQARMACSGKLTVWLPQLLAGGMPDGPQQTVVIKPGHPFRGGKFDGSNVSRGVRRWISSAL